MIPKFNKQTGRWGVWCTGDGTWAGLWLISSVTEQPLRFQSKQEAAAHIRDLESKPV